MPIWNTHKFIIHRMHTKIENIFKKHRKIFPKNGHYLFNYENNIKRYRTLIKYIIYFIIFYLCWVYNIFAYVRTSSFEGFEYPLYASIVLRNYY